MNHWRLNINNRRTIFHLLNIFKSALNTCQNYLSVTMSAMYKYKQDINIKLNSEQKELKFKRLRYRSSAFTIPHSSINYCVSSTAHPWYPIARSLLCRKYHNIILLAKRWLKIQPGNICAKMLIFLSIPRVYFLVLIWKKTHGPLPCWPVEYRIISPSIFDWFGFLFDSGRSPVYI